MTIKALRFSEGEVETVEDYEAARSNPAPCGCG